MINVMSINQGGLLRLECQRCALVSFRSRCQINQGISIRGEEGGSTGCNLCIFKRLFLVTMAMIVP